MRIESNLYKCNASYVQILVNDIPEDFDIAKFEEYIKAYDPERKNKQAGIRHSNMDYLGMNEFEIVIHEAIMGLPINQYPKSLTDKIKRMSKTYGYNGELHISAIAEWIKERTYNFCIPANIITQIVLNNLPVIEYRDAILKRIEEYISQIDRQCVTCANWQNKVHHRTDEGELIYECKKHHVVSPSSTLDKFDKCYENPEEKRRVWECWNCGKDIVSRPEYYKTKQTSNKYENLYQHLNGLVSCVGGHQNLASSDLLQVAIPKPDSERWVSV